jgi:hypothetical protein
MNATQMLEKAYKTILTEKVRERIEKTILIHAIARFIIHLMVFI